MVVVHNQECIGARNTESFAIRKRTVVLAEQVIFKISIVGNNFNFQIIECKK